jgi:hypothetical protein
MRGIQRRSPERERRIFVDHQQQVRLDPQQPPHHAEAERMKRRPST